MFHKNSAHIHFQSTCTNNILHIARPQCIGSIIWYHQYRRKMIQGFRFSWNHFWNYAICSSCRTVRLNNWIDIAGETKEHTNVFRHDPTRNANPMYNRNLTHQQCDFPCNFRLLNSTLENSVFFRLVVQTYWLRNLHKQRLDFGTLCYLLYSNFNK